MTIVFGGDVFLSVDERDASRLRFFDTTLTADADSIVVNYEGPISERGTFANKSVMWSGGWAAELLSENGITHVGLANNHIHDRGKAGVLATVTHLAEQGITCFGVGWTLEQALEPVRISGRLYVAAFCDYDRPYLSNVKVASPDDWGVAPLRLGAIYESLAMVPEGSMTVLMFHWGREHSRLPSPGDVKVAHELLRHPRVAGIIGSHAHVHQGVEQIGCKRAYYGIGHGYFGEFYIRAPCVVSEETGSGAGPSPRKTWRYHTVDEPTKKQWPLRNRLGLTVEYDESDGEWTHSFVLQERGGITRQIAGWQRQGLRLHMYMLSMLLKLPRRIYRVVVGVFWSIGWMWWKVGVAGYRLRTEGAIWLLQTVAGRVVDVMTGREYED